jgi:hypothetical protein
MVYNDCYLFIYLLNFARKNTRKVTIRSGLETTGAQLITVAPGRNYSNSEITNFIQLLGIKS